MVLVVVAIVVGKHVFNTSTKFDANKLSSIVF